MEAYLRGEITPDVIIEQVSDLLVLSQTAWFD
jgi:hypothetical protein